ncbi:MAG: hypothetical protein KJO98_00315, partial [Rhodothermia bacterium]|nr:hypothetical protein [Rhodothermia bacterium]
MRWLLYTGVLLVLLLLPNLIWLQTSTLRIQNTAAWTTYSLEFEACGERHAIGGLASGRSAFRFLDSCGDDTLTIFHEGTVQCQLYVEGEFYHI